ncbi:MAG TPA: type VI secretion system tip protein TssI/VgrG [Candidatus Dormibacteraeota bacterium]|nr:type VI secretion system tip protein TssI/VgrG [Candidatus Dormibacteraeota bacterium]
MPLKQDNRLLAIKTALGPDTLAIRSVTIEEEISQLFEIEAELSSEDADIDFDKVVGHDATIRLNIGQKDKRYFNGIVSRLVQVANQGGYAHYQATIVPWLWFLTRTSDCCIFQEMTIPDIIEDVFKYYGFSDYSLKLSGTYEPWEYCVQYRETDFNFVSRLMEQEGIYYYFEHHDGKHTLVLADSISAHKPFAGYEEIQFHELEGGAMGREVITDWTVEKELQPIAYVLQDFDFTKPKTSLLAQSQVLRKYGKAVYEMYDYPGEYDGHGDGDRLTDVRLNELQSQFETVHGQASARGISPGCTFKLKNHGRDDQNRDYLVTSANLHVDAGEFAAGDKAAGEFFSCSFSAIDKTQQFRASRTTPKPIVQGPQTAIVVGPAGEEIFTDKYSRVKVHFHWDRHDHSNENSSCWIRVSQFWAGKEWGSIHIPRIGQEVIVEFLEGDPDSPIITGRVYNADQMPPYGLPGNKTQSGVKSRSSKGGSGANCNEFRFEDKKGGEQVLLHAEKNQDIEVENDETHWVGHDRSKTIDHDETSHIKHDRTETVDNNETITVHGNRTETVDKNETITVHQNRTETVDANESISVGGNRTRNVAKNESVTVAITRNHAVGVNESIAIGAAQEVAVGAAQTITVGAKQATTVGADQTNSIGKDQTDDVGKNRTTSVGENDTLTVAKKLSIDAGEEITITTGSASISMKKDGTIAIKGKDISIEGSGEINVKASKNITMKGQKILQN